MTQKVFLGGLLFFALGLVGCGGEICNNDADDDKNGLIDCEDPACAADPVCENNEIEICDNGVDDDSEGRVDCADNDCAADPACAPGSAVVIGDGLEAATFSVFGQASIFDKESDTTISVLITVLSNRASVCSDLFDLFFGDDFDDTDSTLISATVIKAEIGVGVGFEDGEVLLGEDLPILLDIIAEVVDANGNILISADNFPGDSGILTFSTLNNTLIASFSDTLVNIDDAQIDLAATLTGATRCPALDDLALESAEDAL